MLQSAEGRATFIKTCERGSFRPEFLIHWSILLDRPTSEVPREFCIRLASNIAEGTITPEQIAKAAERDVKSEIELFLALIESPASVDV